jgi:DNA-binding response OmpR family regulator
MSKKIIVVDDDKEVREIVTFVLKRNGFDVAFACNGEQLHSLLAQYLPQLIILDVMMPGANGYDIYRSLQQNARTRHIPVIIMTAHDEAIYKQISSDLGVAQHITKPFHPLALVEKVNILLRAEN